MAGSGIHPPFHPKENYIFAIPLPYAACCDSPVDKNKCLSLFLCFSHGLYQHPTISNIVAGVWLSRKESYWEEYVWRCVSDEVTAGKSGKPAASDGRLVITPAHEGTVSSVWQSSHNSGLIHHMGIMLLTGRTPQEILYQVLPSIRKSKQSHPPSEHT